VGQRVGPESEIEKLLTAKDAQKIREGRKAGA